MKFLSTLLFSLLLAGNASADTKNNFDLSNSLIPSKDILIGGPPRDGIPSIDNPKFLKANAAKFIRPADRVIGITING